MGGDSPTQPNAPNQKFIVSWFSSRTVREAAARKRELQGVSQDVARKDLAMEFETFQIAVIGPDLSAFAKDGADTLKTNSYLLPKKANEKIAPTKVFLQMGPDGFRPILVLYEFSRKTATGEPTIGSGEKGVDFVTQAGKLRLKVTFDISKMTDKKGTDL